MKNFVEETRKIKASWDYGAAFPRRRTESLTRITRSFMSLSTTTIRPIRFFFFHQFFATRAALILGLLNVESLPRKFLKKVYVMFKAKIESFINK